jgi:hypothetical protein
VASLKPEEAAADQAERVEEMLSHRKERCPDTLLRQVGSLTGKWHFYNFTDCMYDSSISGFGGYPKVWICLQYL